MNGSQDSRPAYPDLAPGSIRPVDGPPPAPPEWRKPVHSYDDPRHKSPALAAVLSFMPGLGQIYVGYYQNGFINILVVGSIIALLNSGGRLVHDVTPLLALFLAFFWLYNVVDAYRRAHFYNQSLAGLGAVEIPDDMRLPKAGGSLAGGIVLIVVGLLLFGNTALGMSLDWLEQWWPIGLVLLGAYLIYGHLSASKRGAKTAGSVQNESAGR